MRLRRTSPRRGRSFTRRRRARTRIFCLQPLPTLPRFQELLPFSSRSMIGVFLKMDDSELSDEPAASCLTGLGFPEAPRQVVRNPNVA